LLDKQNMLIIILILSYNIYLFYITYLQKERKKMLTAQCQKLIFYILLIDNSHDYFISSLKKVVKFVTYLH
jgi:hypothetical protein